MTSNDRNQSAIDTIYEISNKIDQIQSEFELRLDGMQLKFERLSEQLLDVSKKMDVLDYSIKLLNNKFIKLQSALSDSVAVPNDAKKKEQPRLPMAKAVSADTVRTSNEESKQSEGRRKPDRIIIGNVKVFSYLLDRDKRPIVGAEVDVFNENGECVKVKNTDENGYFEFKLPPGNYRAELTLSGYDKTVIPFVIKDGISEYNLR